MEVEWEIMKGAGSWRIDWFYKKIGCTICPFSFWIILSIESEALNSFEARSTRGLIFSAFESCVWMLSMKTQLWWMRLTRWGSIQLDKQINGFAIAWDPNGASPFHRFGRSIARPLIDFRLTFEHFLRIPKIDKEHFNYPFSNTFIIFTSICNADNSNNASRLSQLQFSRAGFIQILAIRNKTQDNGKWPSFGKC